MNEPFDATGALVASLIDAMPEPALVVSNWCASLPPMGRRAPCFRICA